MTHSTEISDGFKEVEPDFGLTFTWASTAYPCTAGNATDMRILGDGGHTVTQDLTINIRRELFTGDIPKTGNRGVYSDDGLSYKIDSVTNPPGTPFVQLVLIEPRKGV